VPTKAKNHPFFAHSKKNVVSRGMSGSAIADSPNSKPAADTEAAVEIDLRKVLREDIFVTATLNP